MHNLAIALHRQGHHVTGSDDVIYGISKTKLEKDGLMPSEFGWFPETIVDSIDTIILGMHAKADNPELLKAHELGLQICSFPEYVAAHTQDKTRIVVAGSHGKTTTTSMIMHVLQKQGISFDFLVGAQLAGFDLMVQLSDAPIVVIEGDEYLSSAIDSRPKFMHYNAHHTIITGVAWDHANVFPTDKIYKQQFHDLLASLDTESSVYFDTTDPDLLKIIAQSSHAKSIGYLGMKGSGNEVNYKDKSYNMNVFGRHNRKNMHAALLVCRDLGISIEDGLSSLESFEGAAMRQDVIKASGPTVYRDFGHAPSKVRATIDAVIENHPNKRIGVLVELHTYSSMVGSFIVNYAGVFDQVQYCAICFDEAAYALKKVKVLADKAIKQAFEAPNAHMIKTKNQLLTEIQKIHDLDVLLFLSSGNFLGLDLKEYYK